MADAADDQAGPDHLAPLHRGAGAVRNQAASRRRPDRASRPWGAHAADAVWAAAPRSHQSRRDPQRARREGLRDAAARSRGSPPTPGRGVEEGIAVIEKVSAVM